MNNPVRDKVAVSTQSPSGIDFDKIARVWVRRLYGAQSLEARNLPVLKEVLMHVAAQAREQCMADTRRMTAIEACKAIEDDDDAFKWLVAHFGLTVKEARFLPDYPYHPENMQAENSPEEETSGTSQAGKST